MTPYTNLVLIHSTRNEIYCGYYNEQPSIFKYTNDESNEVHFMKQLHKPFSDFYNQKFKKTLSIPEIYRHETTNVISPSNKVFKELIIMSEIKGKVLNDSHDNICFNPITIIDSKIKKKLVLDILDLFYVCHQNGVIYGDGLIKNIIVTEDLIPILIDFGNAFTKEKTPKSIAEFPIESMDVFTLMGFAGFLLKIPNKFNPNVSMKQLREMIELT